MVASKNPKCERVEMKCRLNNKHPYPINIKNTIAAVISAPRLAGDNIPNIANTVKPNHTIIQN